MYSGLNAIFMANIPLKTLKVGYTGRGPPAFDS